jgi:hypothetical protein
MVPQGQLISTSHTYGNDGNWVSLRVNGHLGPSTLQSSPVGRITPTTPGSPVGLLAVVVILNRDNTLTRKVLLATNKLWLEILQVILPSTFLDLLLAVRD